MKRTMLFLYLFILVFSPLAFGTVELWSLTVMESLTYLLVLSYLIYKIIRKEPIFRTPGFIPLVLFLGYILIQLIPLPFNVVKILSPHTYQIYQETYGVLGSVNWMTLSFNKKLTVMEFYRYAAYVGIYFMTIQLLSNKERIKRSMLILTSFFLLLSIFAIIQHFTSIDAIYWVKNIPENTDVFGPYINHNHFAGLVVMVLPITIGLFLYQKPNVSYKQSIREKITDILHFPAANVHILLGISAILLTASLIISASKIAVICLCLASVICMGLLFLRGKQIRKGSIILTVIVLLVLSVSWFGWEETLARFSRITTNQVITGEERLAIWEDGIRMIGTFPITGVGFGNFGNVYPRFKSFVSTKSALHAHNDYLELLIEGGIFAFLLLVWFIFELLLTSFKEYNNRRERYSIYLFLGSFTGIIAVLFLSITDINFHIGANGLYFFFVAGLLVAASHTRLRGKVETSLPVIKRLITKPLLLNSAILVLITGVIINIRFMAAEKVFSYVEDIYLNEHIPNIKLEAIRKTVLKAVRFDPLESKYQYALANISSFLPKSPGRMMHYMKAIYLNPSNSEYLQSTGLVAALYVKEKKGDQLLRAGIKSDISNPQRYKMYADWLFSMGQKSAAMEVIQKAIAREAKGDSDRIKEYIGFMLIYNLKEAEMLSIMSKYVGTLIPIGEHFMQSNQQTAAENAFKKALAALQTDDDQQIQYYEKIYAFYMKKRRLQDALNVATQAIEKIPNNVIARIWAAQIYEKQRITYRAKEEYETALTFDPANEVALEGLKRLGY